MRGRPGKGGRRRKGPSAEQRQGNAAFAYVMRTWGALTDEEYLAWNVAAKTRRTHGINYFKQVNLRRVRRGEEPALVLRGGLQSHRGGGGVPWKDRPVHQRD